MKSDAFGDGGARSGRVDLLDRLSRSAPQRHLRAAADSHGLAGRWPEAVCGSSRSAAATPRSSIARGRAFTIEQRGPQEVVAAYDVATGRELWTNAWTGGVPRVDGRRRPARHADLGRRPRVCARRHWRAALPRRGDRPRGVAHRHPEGRRRTNLHWGMAASPLVVDDTVIVLPGGANGRSVVAYDRRTGKRAWAALDDQQAYSSPMLVDARRRASAPGVQRRRA